jgi:hypothetical protein
MSAADEPKGKPDDVLFVHSPCEQGDGFRVIRKRADTIEIGEIRTLKEGRPVHGEVVKLTQRAEHEQFFDVSVLLPALPEGGAAQGAQAAQAAQAAQGERSGPAQVATDAYRANWDTIFGARSGSSEPN